MTKRTIAILLSTLLVALPAAVQAQFTVNFQFINSAGGAVPLYTGAGLAGYGSGTFWNTVPGPSGYRAGTYTSTNSLADDGITDTGISWSLDAIGNWSYAVSGLALFDSYANANTGGQTFTFKHVPDGTYNLVLFGLPANHSAKGTVFTVDGLSQAVVEPQNANTSFLPGTNCVVFTNLVITGGILSGTYQANADTGSSEGHLNGAQLQRVSSTSLFAFAPSISPTNYVYGGTPVTLTANAVGATPVQYQWLTDGGGAALTNLPGATARTLALNTVGLRGDIHYAVAVSDPSGSVTSPTATLTVNSMIAPNFDPNPPTASPGNAVYPASTVTVATLVSGSQPIACQWQVNHGSGFADIPGATNPTLSLTNVQSADAGTYRLHASNSVGATDSAPVTLTVLASPPAPLAGSFAAAVLANAPICYWRLNDPAGASQIYDFAGSHPGVNENVQLAQAGLQSPAYPGFSADNTAGVFNGSSSAVPTGASLMNGLTNFTLLGWFSPTGPNPDHSGLFGQNDAVEFGYSDSQGVNLWIPTAGGGWVNPRTGSSGFTYGQWYFVALVADGTNVTIYVDDVQRAQAANVGAPSGTSNFGFNIGGDGVFDPSANYFNGQIEDVALFGKVLTWQQLQGLYHVAVGDLAPTILTQPASQIVFAGHTVQFSVAAGGVPLNYQWRGGPVGGPYTNLLDGGNISGAQTPTLTLARITADQAGEYLVLVTNSLGSVSSDAAGLTVLPMPAGQWIANFDFDTTPGGDAGTYNGPGVLGSGKFWNSIPGPSAWAQGSYTSSSGLADDGVSDTGISLSLVMAGNWSNPKNNGLLDDFAEALNGVAQPFTFNNLVPGVYNVVLFGINGGYNDRSTTFTVNGISQTTTNTTDVSFIAGDNYVLYAGVVVAGETLSGTWAANPIPYGTGINNEGDFCGAQLQYLGAIPPSVSLKLEPIGGGQFRLEWSQGTLQSTANLTEGSWAPVTGASSPYTNSMTGPQMFYRLQVSP